LVVKGHIEVLARNADGAEFAVGFITAGGWATWFLCFMDTPPENDFYSSAAATFITLPISEVRALCERFPCMYPPIIQQIGRRMRLLIEWTGQSVLVGPVQRMAKLIHIMALEQQASGNSVSLRITQARLAGLARCSRQTANALVGELAAQGLLTSRYGSVLVPDLARLAAFASAPVPQPSKSATSNMR
jgi:CRP-like cAMP-binding protein